MSSAGQAELPYFVALCREPEHHSHIRWVKVVSPARREIESRAPLALVINRMQCQCL